MIILLKFLSQLLIVVSGIVGLLSEPYEKRDGRRHLKPAGRVLLSCILLGFALFVVMEVVRTKEAARASAAREAEYDRQIGLLESAADERDAQIRMLESAAAEREAAHAEAIRIAQSTASNRPIREIEVRWRASEAQLRSIDRAFARLRHPQAESWGRAGVMGRWRGADWHVVVLGVQERVEAWHGSSALEGFEDLARVVDRVILSGLAVRRSGSADARLLDGTTVMTDFTIGRNGVITATTHGRDLLYATLAPGEVRFVVDAEYASREELLPHSLTLVSHDEQLVLDQEFALRWRLPEERSAEEEESVVAKPPPVAPSTDPHTLTSRFTWNEPAP